jgi:uncharacterized membrane protein
MTLAEAFGHVCGQVHQWAPGGRALPFCQRCTGLYVGALFTAVAWLLWRPRPTARALWLHGATMLLMIPFGYHLVPQGDDVRTLTGALFAVGLVYFLALEPAGLLPPRQASPASAAAYVVASLAAGPLLLVAVRSPSEAVGAALAWTGAAGFLLLAALALANVALLAGRVARSASAR